ncbi:SNARE-associated protein Snapin-like [Mytilus californianus]|uniref:SNARE-associated protein Snapin-like n=1 Tax=Mytilus californianus TaxID=6549 RepID=UPI0022483299|nr:SNARE-associated protein Snapin-like [Mytilus californianus]
MSSAVANKGEEKPLDCSTRDAIADGLVDLLKPSVEEVDSRVKTVRESQIELRQQIDLVAEDLKKIAELQGIPIDLEPYVKKLNNSRRRVMLVNNILQNSQDRLNKLYSNVSKETAKQKALVDPQTK